jgi:hypothetical protein
MHAPHRGGTTESGRTGRHHTTPPGLTPDTEFLIMPKADNKHTPSRRTMLTGASAAILAGAAATAVAHVAPAVPDGADGADAELIRLHLALVAQLDEVARVQDALHHLPLSPASNALEQRWDAADGVWWNIADQIAGIPARGVPGQRAKAAALLLVLEHGVLTDIGDTLDDIAAGNAGDPDHRLALSLARDLIGGTPA